MDELKPCPFCGDNKAEIENDSDGDGMHKDDRKFWVRCTKCGAHSSEARTREEAIEAWNRVSAGLAGGLTMTNAERIRRMTDEELADFLMCYVEPCNLCAWRKECDKHHDGCENGRLAWLREDWEG